RDADAPKLKFPQLPSALDVPDQSRMVAGLESMTGPQFGGREPTGEQNSGPLASIGRIGSSSLPTGYSGFVRDLNAGRVPRVVGPFAVDLDPAALREHRILMQQFLGDRWGTPLNYCTDRDIAALSAFKTHL